MNPETSAYGLWSLVILNSLVFIIFAFGFTKPQTARDWRSLGAFSAFIVALFTEMYGFPLPAVSAKKTCCELLRVLTREASILLQKQLLRRPVSAAWPWASRKASSLPAVLASAVSYPGSVSRWETLL